MECCGTETETSNSPCNAAHWKDAPAQDHDEPCTPGSDSGQALLDLVLESRYGPAQSYLEPVPELRVRPPVLGEPDSEHSFSQEPYSEQSEQRARWPDADSDVEKRRLRRHLRRQMSELHRLQDSLAQAQADLAREKRHSDLKVGIQLRRLDSRISGFHNGVVTYNKPPENMATTHYRLFGTHKEVGPGPFKHGSWMEWGKPFKPLSHEFVSNWVAERDAKLAAQAARSQQVLDDWMHPRPASAPFGKGRPHPPSAGRQAFSGRGPAAERSATVT